MTLNYHRYPKKASWKVMKKTTFKTSNWTHSNKLKISPQYEVMINGW